MRAGIVTLMIVFVVSLLVAVMCAGCQSLLPDNPREYGNMLAEDYLLAESAGYTEAVAAGELAYEALKELVEGPSPTLDGDTLETLVRDLGRARGLPEPTITVALIAGKKARRMIRRFAGVSPTVRQYHAALAQIKAGIDETLEEHSD